MDPINPTNPPENASEDSPTGGSEPEMVLGDTSEAPLEPQIPTALNGNVNPEGIRDILRRTARPNFKNRGGARLHKDPNCKCVGCSSRRRSEEARFSPTGAGGAGVVTPTEAEVSLQRTGNRTQIVAEEYNPSSTKKQSAKVRVAQWLGTRAIEPDLSNSEIARRMGISPQALRASITKGVSEGWLKFDDPIQAIEYQIIPKVVRNLNHFLDEGDKQVTIETAKGTLFKSWQEANTTVQAPQTVLALKIEFPEGVAPQTPIIQGTILGTPKRITD